MAMACCKKKNGFSKPKILKNERKRLSSVVGKRERWWVVCLMCCNVGRELSV